MTHWNSDIVFGRKKGGTRIVAALFGVLLLAVLSVRGTRAFLYPHDTLAQFVPEDAVVYVHYRAVPGMDTVATRRVFGIPRGIQPPEASVFAVPDDGDGLRWAMLVSWRTQKDIRIDERLRLNEIASRQLADATYLIGQPDALADAQGSFEDRYGAMLATLRSLAPAQALFHPSILPVDVFADADGAGRLIGAAASIGPDAIRITTVSANVLRDAAPLIGFGLHHRVGSAPHHDATPATVSLAEANASFDPVMLLFPDVLLESSRLGVPGSAALSASLHDVRAALGGPLALDVFSEATDKGYGYALRYPELSMDDLLGKVRGFLRNALPESRQFRLPDGEWASEFVTASSDPLSAHPDGTATLSLDGKTVFVIAPYDTGVIVASTPGLRRKIESAAVTIDPDCRVPAGDAKLTLRAPLAVFSRGSLLNDPIRRMGISFLAVSRTGDNSMFLCGLIGANVDN